MILYRYGPYEPEGDGTHDLDMLMSLLSEMILKYDIELDEALSMMINKGLPVNLFLKEGGLEDLVNSYIETVQKKIDDIFNGKITLIGGNPYNLQNNATGFMVYSYLNGSEIWNISYKKSWYNPEYDYCYIEDSHILEPDKVFILVRHDRGSYFVKYYLENNL